MSVTEANIKVNPNAMITLGSREVMGKHSGRLYSLFIHLHQLRMLQSQ